MDPEAVDFIQLTDLHIAPGNDAMWGLDTFESFDCVTAEALKTQLSAQMILLTGDLAQDPVTEAYTRIYERLKDSSRPVYRLPGNHDDPHLLDMILNGGAFHTDRCIRKAAWQLILLDSTQPESPGGRLSPAELNRLIRILDERPDLHALVCLHHNPLPVNSRWLDTMTVANAPEFFAVLDSRPQVRGVIFGHIHQEFQTRRNGVLYLGSPSTCVQFKRNSPEFALTDLPPGYRHLRLLADGTIETQVNYVHGKSFLRPQMAG